MDPYSVLGVAQDASLSEIRQAYVTLARLSHPDVRGGDDVAGEEMRRINQAWETLSDPVSRAEVDRRLRTEQSEELAEPSNWRRTSAKLPNWLIVGIALAAVSGIVGVLIGAATLSFVLVRFSVLLLVATVLIFAFSLPTRQIGSKNQHHSNTNATDQSPS